MFSVIIPTYHEGKYLGRLLKSIREQTLQPDEIIVADRPSDDNTRTVARQYGCKIVEGGIIPVGRNAGARAAKSDLLVFIDADCQLDKKDFFNRAIGQFISLDADIASCFTRDILEKNKFPLPTQLIVNMQRVLNMVTSKVFKKIIGDAGACMICKKSFFDKMGGFNEKMQTMEDSEFFQRSIEIGGRYVVLAVALGTSNRRFSSRPIVSTIRVSAMLVALSFAALLGVRSLSKMKKKYDKEKGSLGGKNLQ